MVLSKCCNRSLTEVGNFLRQHRDQLDEQGHRLVVGNGHLPARQIQTGLGSVEVRQPRVHDKREDHQFTSAILPPYLRRVAALDNLIPASISKAFHGADGQRPPTDPR